MNERMMANSVPCCNQIDISDMLLIVDSTTVTTKTTTTTTTTTTTGRVSVTTYV